MKVRFCENNEGSTAVYKRLKADFPGHNIKRKDCVKCCSTCNSSLFVVAGGKQLRGKTAEELYGEIAALLTAESASPAD